MTEAPTLECPTSTGATEAVSVAANNFVRAESDRYFGNSVAANDIGRFDHVRELMP